MKTVEFAASPVTTRKKPAAKVGADGKPAPARTGVSDVKIAALLAKFGKPEPVKAV
jgi:hypothetical protein